MQAQEEFDRQYITSAEIRQRTGLTRGGLTHCVRHAKCLPAPIEVKSPDGVVVMLVWVRAGVEPWVRMREAAKAA